MPTPAEESKQSQRSLLFGLTGLIHAIQTDNLLRQGSDSWFSNEKDKTLPDKLKNFLRQLIKTSLNEGEKKELLGALKQNYKLVINYIADDSAENMYLYTLALDQFADQELQSKWVKKCCYSYEDIADKLYNYIIKLPQVEKVDAILSADKAGNTLNSIFLERKKDCYEQQPMAWNELIRSGKDYFSSLRKNAQTTSPQYTKDTNLPLLFCKDRARSNSYGACVPEDSADESARLDIPSLRK